MPAMKIPSVLSTLSFVAIVLGLCLLLLLGVGCAGRALAEPHAKTRKVVGVSALALGGWLAFTGALTASGQLARTTPIPLLLPFVLLSLAVAALAAASALGTRLVRGLSITALVGFQAFRLPLELVLHSWVEQGVIPVQMSFTGDNFDIVSGVLAIALAVWSWKADKPPRIAIAIWNVLGSALLAVVM
ncbi:MAG TPA: hypothetical protein VHZ95_18275, partial [Polyangiales bacterium]|nr:hypothetical protein [Polyangiales bacterium]